LMAVCATGIDAPVSDARYNGAQEFGSFDEADAFGKREWEDMNELSDKEQMSLVSYTEDSAPFNSSLRSGTQIPDEFAQEAATIDKVMRWNETPEDIIAHRVVGREFVDFTEGTVFTDAAYTSTTIAPETILSELLEMRPEDIVCDIFIPRGTKSLYMGALFEDYNVAELVLARGMKFRIRKRLANKIILEVVP